MKEVLTNVGGAFLLLVLLVAGVSTNSMLAAIAAVGVTLALVVLVGIGPEKMGIGLMLIAMVLAPLNALKIGSSGNVTFSDLVFVASFALLAPRMLRHRPTLPPLYLIGITILFTGGIVASLLAIVPALSIFAFLRLIAAAIILPFIMNLVRPTGKLLDALAAAYVFGQMISTGYSLVRGSAASALGRSIGLTTQPNFYGLGGQMAYALLIFLFYRVDPRRRWMVIGAMGVVLYSVLNSGSRASLLCCIVVTLAWLLVERSALTWYWLGTGGALMLVAANYLLASSGSDTALSRLFGDSTSSASDQARTLLLQSGFALFWQHPIRGNGFDGVVAYHNAYLEVAIAGGVLTAFGFILMIASLIRPLLNAAGPNRLAFVGLSYAAFGLIGPTLYDRIVWAALALVLVTENAPPPVETVEADQQDVVEADQTPAVAGKHVGAAAGRRSLSPRLSRSH